MECGTERFKGTNSGVSFVDKIQPLCIAFCLWLIWCPADQLCLVVFWLRRESVACDSGICVLCRVQLYTMFALYGTQIGY